jgi:peptidoglycan/xylan/chitin deacetylase (PgdA/CDA1 family)
MNFPRPAVLRAAVLASLLAAFGAPASAAERAVAVTFDDLPGPRVALLSNDVPALRENTRKLLAALRSAKVPVVGFVNEGKLFVEGETSAVAEERIDVLRLWLASGHELGNHTYSHRDLNTQPLDWFEQDVVRGEAVTRRLLAEKKRSLRYFRHPFLHVGLELDKRRAFETFLAGRGYTVAPVTIDNDEYIYAEVYADARRRGDGAMATRLADDYSATWSRCSRSSRASRAACSGARSRRSSSSTRTPSTRTASRSWRR